MVPVDPEFAPIASSLVDITSAKWGRLGVNPAAAAA